MRTLADLTDRLSHTQGKPYRRAILVDYFRHAARPDCGWVAAVLIGEIALPRVGSAALKRLAAERLDETLFTWSRDYVGDLGETIALLWPGLPGGDLCIADVVQELIEAEKSTLSALVANCLDKLDTRERWVFLRLVTGGPRVPVSALEVKQALAEFGGTDTSAVEEVWHSLTPPYEPLFAWLGGRGEKPRTGGLPVFHPPVAARPIEESDLNLIESSEYFAEWKWDGARVQLVGLNGARRVFSREGDDITAAHTELSALIPEGTVLDGELLASGEVRLFDILVAEARDLRPEPYDNRRSRLQSHLEADPVLKLSLSPLLPYTTVDDLKSYRSRASEYGAIGIMVKPRHVPWSPREDWLAWNIDDRRTSAVLLYCERMRNGALELTLGRLRGNALAPVGRVRADLPEDEMSKLHDWISENRTDRFGPVQQVRPDLVCEVAFSAVDTATRRKAGLVLRNPKLLRILWDMPADAVMDISELTGLAR